jgi:hypothetical protein
MVHKLFILRLVDLFFTKNVSSGSFVRMLIGTTRKEIIHKELQESRMEEREKETFLNPISEA